MYELELIKHQETEARLRESALREHALVREKDELLVQKDILRKESEHRFLNGLQLIGSLLSLQSSTVGNAEVEEQLALAANRVGTLARVHRHLHTLDNVESVEFGQFLKTLCDDLAGMTSNARRERSLIVEAEPIQIPALIGIPLGFIACELITNSIKYANDRIVVRLQQTATGAALSLSDNGPGLPHGFDPSATKGLGMKVVMALVKQIGGVLDIGKGDGDRGSRFTVRFPS